LLIGYCGHAENGEFSNGKMTRVWHQKEEDKLSRIISLKNGLK
jgi:hypothetical protein